MKGLLLSIGNYLVREVKLEISFKRASGAQRYKDL